MKVDEKSGLSRKEEISIQFLIVQEVIREMNITLTIENYMFSLNT